jgi:hypothetical protein
MAASLGRPRSAATRRELGPELGPTSRPPPRLARHPDRATRTPPSSTTPSAPAPCARTSSSRTSRRWSARSAPWPARRSRSRAGAGTASSRSGSTACARPGSQSCPALSASGMERGPKAARVGLLIVLPVRQPKTNGSVLALSGLRVARGTVGHPRKARSSLAADLAAALSFGRRVAPALGHPRG